MCIRDRLYRRWKSSTRWKIPIANTCTADEFKNITMVFFSWWCVLLSIYITIYITTYIPTYIPWYVYTNDTATFITILLLSYFQYSSWWEWWWWWSRWCPSSWPPQHPSTACTWYTTNTPNSTLITSLAYDLFLPLLLFFSSFADTVTICDIDTNTNPAAQYASNPTSHFSLTFPMCHANTVTTM